MSNQDDTQLCHLLNDVLGGFRRRSFFRCPFRALGNITTEKALSRLEYIESSDFRSHFFNEIFRTTNKQHFSGGQSNRRGKIYLDPAEETNAIEILRFLWTCLQTYAQLDHLKTNRLLLQLPIQNNTELYLSADSPRLLSPGCPPPTQCSDLPFSLDDSILYLTSEFVDLRLCSGDILPLFGLAFLYDSHHNRRISEVFHFDTNSDHLITLFADSKCAQQTKYRDWETMARSCLFRFSLRTVDNSSRSVARASFTSRRSTGHCGASASSAAVSAAEEFSSLESLAPEVFGDATFKASSSDPALDGQRQLNCQACCPCGVFLVIRVEGVLQPDDICDFIDLAQKDAKSKEHLQSTVGVYCRRLGQYRTPVAWTAVDLTPLFLVTHMIRPTETVSHSNSLRSPREYPLDSPRNEADRTASQPGKRAQSLDHVKDPNRVHSPESPPATRNTSTDSVNSPNNKDEWSREPVESLLPSVDLRIETFYKQEVDKLSDDELGRCLNEIHRQTVTNPLVTKLDTNLSETSLEDLSGQLTASLDPHNFVLKRLRLVPCLHLSLRLVAANQFTLASLLRSTGQPISPRDDAPTSATGFFQPKSILTPSYSAYTNSIFRVPPSTDSRRALRSPSAKTRSERENRPMLEVLELPSSLLMQPFEEYKNILYVYPRCVSLSSSRFTSSRNIAICIQLIRENVSKSEILPAIYGKSNSSAFVHASFTTVVYHNRAPDLYDEIKIQLPADLCEDHYLLFTFAHVSCHAKKVSSTSPLEAIIGYSWLPILQNGTLTSANLHLMISIGKPLPPMIRLRPRLKLMSEKGFVDSVKWVDPNRELFSIQTCVVSSLYPQDTRVDTIVSACSPSRLHETLHLLNMKLVSSVVEGIRSAKISQLVAYIGPLLDGLIRLTLCGCVLSSSDPAFHSLYLLLQFVDHVCTAYADGNDSFGRNRLLVCYLAGSPDASTDLAFLSSLYGCPLFGIPLLDDLLQRVPNNKTLLSKFLPEHILTLFTLTDNGLKRCELIPMKSWWFLFELLIRLFVEYTVRKSNTSSNAVVQHYLIDFERWAPSLSEFIRTLTRFIISRPTQIDDTHTIHNLNRSLAFFFFDLFPLVPTTFILTEILNYYTTLRNHLRELCREHVLHSDSILVEDLVLFEVEFLKIVSRHRLCVTLIEQAFYDPLSTLFTPTIINTVLTPKEDGPKWMKLLSPKCRLDKGSMNFFILLNLTTLELCFSIRSHKLQSLSVAVLCSSVLNHCVLQTDSDEQQQSRRVRRAAHFTPKFSSQFLGLLCLLDTLVSNGLTRCLPSHTNPKVPHTNIRRSSSDNSLKRSPHQSVDVEHIRFRKQCVSVNQERISGESFPDATKPPSSSRISAEIPQASVVPDSHWEWNSVKSFLLIATFILCNLDESLFDEYIRSLDSEGRNRLVVALFIGLSACQENDFNFTNPVPITDAQTPLKCNLFRELVSLRLKQSPGRASTKALKVRHRECSLDALFTPLAEKQSRAACSATTPRSSKPDQEAFTSAVTLTIIELIGRVVTIIRVLDSVSSVSSAATSLAAASEWNKLVPFYTSEIKRGVNVTTLDLLCRVLLYALHMTHSQVAYISLFDSLRKVLNEHRRLIFEDRPELIASFVHHLFFLCASPDSRTRICSIRMLYHIIETNYAVMQDLSQIASGLYMAFASSFNPSIRHLTSNQHEITGPVFEEKNLLGRYQNLKCSLQELLHLPPCSRDSGSDSMDNEVLVNSPLGTKYDFSFKLKSLVDSIVSLTDESATLQSMLLSPNFSRTELLSGSEVLHQTVDLICAIALQNIVAPEVRIQWLLFLAERYREFQQFLESAECYSHCLALIAEHMSDRHCDIFGHVPLGCSEIAALMGNLNLLEETYCEHFSDACNPSLSISGNLGFPFDQDANWYFSSNGWCALIKWAATAYAKTGFHDLIPRLYGLFVSALGMDHHLNQLLSMCDSVREAFSLIEQQPDKARLFNSYYRVRFYGTLFGSLTVSDFVYREPALRRLVEVTERIRTFYAKKWGDEQVVVIQNPNDVNPETLPKGKAYIQVTYVEPYFDEFELRRRTTAFRKNYSIKRFIHSVPFTAKGSAHGGLQDQHQRKIVLTVERHFPYIKSRLAVVSVSSTVLSPIEVATGDVMKRVRQLEDSLNAVPVDSKFLQMFLQGCIGTTVNQGPLEVAHTFLTNLTSKPYGPHIPPHLKSSVIVDEATYVDARNMLRVAFRRMLDVCQRALMLNRLLIGLDQVEYHREMERQFANVSSQLLPLINYEYFHTR